jgi:hypothetical protein
MVTDKFGFSPFTERVTYSGGEIAPLPDHAQAQMEMAQRTSRDGYVYPNLSMNDSERPPQPWPLHRLPVSHSVTISDCASVEELRHGEGAFLIHLFGFLTGTRCQFGDWWVDARVSTRGANGFEVHREWEVRRSIEAALKVWRTFNERTRLVATNALFFHNRTAAYSWDWERFQAEYQVLDALYSVARQLDGLSGSRSHGQRMGDLADRYGMAVDETRMKRIIGSRNELIHEALWEGYTPTATASRDSHRIPQWLHRFNARLVLAIYRVPAEATRSPWWGLGRHAFGMAPEQLGSPHERADKTNV